MVTSGRAWSAGGPGVIPELGLDSDLLNPLPPNCDPVPGPASSRELLQAPFRRLSPQPLLQFGER